MTRAALLALIAAVSAAACQPSPADDAGAEPSLRALQHGPVPEPPEFEGDPSTAAKLGTAIFFDKRLSGSGHTDCDSCHVHTTSFQDNLTGSTPDSSYPNDSPSTERNTPS